MKKRRKSIGNGNGDNVGKTIVNRPFGNGLYMFIPPIYDDLGDGLLLFTIVLTTFISFALLCCACFLGSLSIICASSQQGSYTHMVVS